MTKSPSLTVEIQAKSAALVCNLALERAEWGPLRTHFPPSHSIPAASAGRKERVLIGNHAVANEMVAHTDSVECGLLERFGLSHRTADNHVVGDRVVHLVAVLDVDSRTSAVVVDVVFDAHTMCAVYGRACTIALLKTVANDRRVPPIVSDEVCVDAVPGRGTVQVRKRREYLEKIVKF